MLTEREHFIHMQALWQLMRDEQHGHLAFELVDGPGEVLGIGGVEVGRGFVEDENARLFEQGAGDGDALFLAARKPLHVQVIWKQKK